MTSPDLVMQVDPDDLAGAAAKRLSAGGRFAGMVAMAEPQGCTSLRILVADGDTLGVVRADLPAGRDRYPALTPSVPGAFWYEREIYDLFGLVAVGHPRLDPLVFPLSETGEARPRPGRPDQAGPLDPDTSALPGHVRGEGVFTLPYGPVRSGVFETVEYLVETFGEDIPQLRIRPYLKHRGVARRFAGLGLEDATLLAERVEGTLSGAHAIAFCQAVEGLAGVEVPPAAELLRLVHAELERVANHLDSMLRHTEGASQAVAHARLGVHKERVLRLRAALCGSRYGRGVVVPGGTAGPPHLDPAEAGARARHLENGLRRDLAALMSTPSFLDRLRAAGVLAAETAERHGALGPVGRGCGVGPDVRSARPYGAYTQLHLPGIEVRSDGDALARQWVRTDEIATSWRLVRRALGQLSRQATGPWRRRFDPVDGTGLGWVEAPQGELLYLVEVRDGRVAQAKARTASFHNFALFSEAFSGDIFTDFVFIEASFGVSLAGVAG